MSLLAVLLGVCVVGILLWCINAYLPMEVTVKKILNALVIIILVIWLLKAFGVWGSLSQIHI